MAQTKERDQTRKLDWKNIKPDRQFKMIAFRLPIVEGFNYITFTDSLNYIK